MTTSFIQSGLGIVSIVAVISFLGFMGAPFWAWGVMVVTTALGWGAPLWMLAAMAGVVVLGAVPPLRAAVLTRPIMDIFRKLKIFPKISETEREVIEAGTVWVEGELFSGKPRFKEVMSQAYPGPTAAEQEFIDGPVQELCAMIDDWKIWQERKLPDSVWDYIKGRKFLGMIIPKEYGGLGFTPLGHSEVIRCLASRSVVVATYVMVPNSLGPAELLIHYGTEEQKQYYLPRLATGEEIPCFALTEPLAGSDAGSITAEGVLFKGGDGKLSIRLNWDKRWITLASISTVIGLAFRLKDPEHLLGREEDLGITCALIPSSTPGVVIGLRHDPLGMPFHNCPTQGINVTVSADAIIGGIENAGKGWRMLMESLAAGRGISFPAQCAGETQLITRVVTAHAMVRQQFGISIGRFEGVQEMLVRIAGWTYALEALRRYTLSALNQGLKPAIVTAIAKYYSTERARDVVNHGMDVMGGSGISLGPRNLLAHIYIGTPIGITVEGANILTRSLMIFGQGALRAHPFAYREIQALERDDVREFDLAFWGHVGHVVRNLFRSVLLSLTRGWLAFGHPRGRATAVYYRRLGWASASFALFADLAMGSLGGKLKRRESLSGRFADVLAYMYMGSAVLRRFHAEGERKEDESLLHYSMGMILEEIQEAFDGILANLPVPGLGWLFRGPVRLWSKISPLTTASSDEHVVRLADRMLEDRALREHLTQGIYLPSDPAEQLARLEIAVEAFRKAHDPAKKQKDPQDLAHWESIRREIIQVDAFDEGEYLRHSGGVSRAPVPMSGLAVSAQGRGREASRDDLHGASDGALGRG